MSVLLFCVLVGLVVSDQPFHEHCRERLAVGRQNVRRTAADLIASEGRLLMSQYRAAFADIHRTVRERREAKEEDEVLGTTQGTTKSVPFCPKPNATMFTTAPPPTQPPAPTQPGVSSTQASTTTGNGGAAATSEASGGTTVSEGSTAGAQPTASGTVAADEIDEGVFAAKPLYFTQNDPVAAHFKKLHNYLDEPDKVCDNSFTDINSITEHQFYGFLASLASAHEGPFCSICHRMVDEVTRRALTVTNAILTEEEQLMARLMFSHIPSPMGICSALAPGCYEDYDIKTSNYTDSVICAECSACMSITNVLQHRWLVNQDGLLAVKKFLQGSLFHNICAEMCPLLTSSDVFNVMFPGGWSYDGCQDWFSNVYDGVVKFLAKFTRPERLCSLELGWCELNEVPNMLHCLREFCQDFMNIHPTGKLVCSLIPDSPEEADEFLNIRRTKKYKQRKAYHDSETSGEHDEL